MIVLISLPVLCVMLTIARSTSSEKRSMSRYPLEREALSPTPYQAIIDYHIIVYQWI